MTGRIERERKLIEAAMQKLWERYGEAGMPYGNLHSGLEKWIEETGNPAFYKPLRQKADELGIK